MDDDDAITPCHAARWPWARACAVWAVAWLLMLGLDRHIGLAQAAITLALASALAAIWLPTLASFATRCSPSSRSTGSWCRPSTRSPSNSPKTCC